jgi:hypothetical protein
VLLVDEPELVLLVSLVDEVFLDDVVEVAVLMDALVIAFDAVVMVLSPTLSH